MRANQLPQQEKDSNSQKIKPQNPWKGLFPRISVVFHCINFGVAMFIGTTKLIQFNDAPPKCTPLNLKNAGRKLIIPAQEKIFFLY